MNTDSTDKGPTDSTEKTSAAEAAPDPGAELAKAQAKADEYLDLARRTKADFLNYQDRMRREREQLVRYAIESFVRDLVPALESLRHSFLTLREGTDPKAVLDGVAIVEKEFLRVLVKNGIQPIETSGKSFDPQYHEAVGTLEREDVAENTIVEEVRSGWMLNDRVLRPAAVRIAKKPAAPEHPADSPSQIR